MNAMVGATFRAKRRWIAAADERRCPRAKPTLQFDAAMPILRLIENQEVPILPTDRILIVEDEGIVALNMERTLTRLGYDVIAVAGSSAEAVSLAAAHTPDLVLMDINLGPGADGIDTAALLGGRRSAPVIYLTAYSEDATLARARETGAYGYLLKPFSERELHATIQMALARHRSDASVDRREEDLRLALEAAEMGVWELEVDPSIQEDALAQEAPATAESRTFGGTWANFQAYIAPEDRSVVRGALIEAQAHGRPVSVEFQALGADGSRPWLRIQARSQSGKPSRLLGVAQDVTLQRQGQDQMHHLAHHDPLTGLPNRRLALDRLDQAIIRARRHKWLTAVVMVDLDKFKIVNDTLGHSAGDELLCVVASRLRAALRAEDTVGRIGGDEFILVLESVSDRADLSMIAGKLLQAIDEPLILNGCEVQPSASLGIAVFPEDDEDRDSLLRAADAAMYSAKKAGRNGFAFYTAAHPAAAIAAA